MHVVIVVFLVLRFGSESFPCELRNVRACSFPCMMKLSSVFEVSSDGWVHGVPLGGGCTLC